MLWRHILSLALLCLAPSGASWSLQQSALVPATDTDRLREATVGMQALQSWYNQATGLYETTGWWNSANAITVLINYTSVSHHRDYLPVLSNTLRQAQTRYQGFLNQYYDDEGWWALAWIDAYDLTGDKGYLAMAASIFADMSKGWDSTCGGGIWWSKERKYKNAIANELFLSVAAHLAARSKRQGERREYTGWARREWKWFADSGMINQQHLVNDGLDATCKNNQKNTWSYNQGVIVGGLVELNRVTRDPELPRMARAIAASTLMHLTDSNGIMHDTCEPDCGADGVQFKGIFVRNLMSLYDRFPDPLYKTFVATNAKSIWKNAQGTHQQFGQVWSGPFDAANAGRQSSALDVFVAAARIQQNAGRHPRQR